MIGEVGRVDLLVARRRRHLARQVLLATVMAACTSCPESMLRLRSNWMTIVVAPSALNEVSWLTPGSARTAARAGGDRRGHGLRARALEVGGDLDGRKVHLRQRSDRQEWKGDQADEGRAVSSVVATGRRMNGSR